jgi:hypothetical protein
MIAEDILNSHDMRRLKDLLVDLMVKVDRLEAER